MQAVILMAGKGTRMAKYYDGPKQLLPINGKPTVEYLLDQLPDEVRELIMIVGGPHEARIREYFSSGQYKGKSIRFVKQEQQLGLAHAFWCAAPYVVGRWLGSVGDDIFGEGDLKRLIAHEGPGVLAARVPNPESFGVLVMDKGGYLVRAVEKPKEFVSDLVWCGAMVMDNDFFTTKVEPSARGEYETPDVWMKLINDKQKKITVVEASLWLPVNDKPQLEEAERILGKK
jgi:dTDP-glucose pyrophosphorylase